MCLLITLGFSLYYHTSRVSLACNIKHIPYCDRGEVGTGFVNNPVRVRLALQQSEKEVDSPWWWKTIVRGLEIPW